MPAPHEAGSIPSAAPLLTSEQTAQELKVSERTLEDWRRTGAGPPFIRISRRCVRYRRADIEAWLAERLKASTSAA
jgi:predicted DNA-binding transcriptional regulator AlpA